MNKKKIIFFLIMIFLILIVRLESATRIDDNDPSIGNNDEADITVNGNNNNIEISIGGGITPNLEFKFHNTPSYYLNDVMVLRSSIDGLHKDWKWIKDKNDLMSFDLSICPGVLISTSVSYYLIPAVTIGFDFNFNYMPSLYISILNESRVFNFQNTFNFNFLVIHKFGEREKKRFVLEWGCLLNIENRYGEMWVETNDYVSYVNSNYDLYNYKLYMLPTNFIGAGPMIAIGSENIKKNFAYDFIFYVAGNFGECTPYSTNTFSVDTFNYNITVGAQFKWSFNKLISFPKKTKR